MKQCCKLIVFILLCGDFLLFSAGCSRLNPAQTTGVIDLPGLTKPVRVVRDEKQMAYIYAEKMDDLVFAQGFVTAQDRLFQMEMIRRYAAGKLAEIAGDAERERDIKNRTIGFRRQAKKHVPLLDDETANILRCYVAGINAFIDQDKLPLELKLIQIVPQHWEVADCLSIAYFMGWHSAANLSTEIISQMLIEKLGLEKARDLFPLNINPDDSQAPSSERMLSERQLHIRETAGDAHLAHDRSLKSWIMPSAYRIGSNNWAISPKLAQGTQPVVANDPHLDSRFLPGIYYPIGLILPDLRIVSASFPGTPAFVIGRTSHFAIGVTNSYSDGQDVYIETIDPNNPKHYLEGEVSKPFEYIEETLKIQDDDAPEGFREERLTIAMTRRGPVISGLFPDVKPETESARQHVLTIRWSPFENMGIHLGLLSELMTAKNVDEIRKALEHVTTIMLNFVFADTNGNIGWQTTGKLPIRAQKESLLPFWVEDSSDNWLGWIPFDEMPHAVNPSKGWLGTCNHKVVKNDYPYYYSSYFSPSDRYRRLSQLLDSKSVFTVADHWRFQRDTKNMMAEALVPRIVAVLKASEETRELAQILSEWNFHDSPEAAAPLIFQEVFRQFAYLVFVDELGESLTQTMLGTWYYWKENLLARVAEGSWEWFDIVTTADKKETMNDLIRLAALRAAANLKARQGGDPAEWQWGAAHQIEFISPLRRDGFGKIFFGGSTHPMGGSGETLYRSIYEYDKPYDVTVHAALRMVADLADQEKVLAVVSGGVSGRTFNPHFNDQTKPYMNGEMVYWWFSDEAIESHRKDTLELRPVSQSP